MSEYLILRLQGVMQAWGSHTYEDYRPVEPFPTRSGIIGLLGGCLGMDRKDVATRDRLTHSVKMAVRADHREIASARITDFHTVLQARMAKGNDKSNKNAVMSYREYLCDAQFTVALWLQKGAFYTLDQLEHAVRHPCYTPVLGRRACPITRPLFECRVEAEGVVAALATVSPGVGTLYSEESDQEAPRLRVRDVPMRSPHRQFATRDLYLVQQEPIDVSE